MAPSAMAAALLLALGAPARGDLPSDSTGLPPHLDSRTRAGLSFALVHASVLDPVASPLRYGGIGPGVQLQLSRGAADSRRLFEVVLEAEAPRLSSALSGAVGASERMALAALRASDLRRVGSVLPGQLLLGGQARLEATLRDHHYAEAANDFYFGLAFASVGPAAAWLWEQASGAGLRLDAAAPLLGLAYRPYGDIAYTRSGIHPRLAAPPALLGLDAGARWTLPLGNAGARALLEWRVGYRRYRDHDLYRAARDRLSATLELPLQRAR